MPSIKQLVSVFTALQAKLICDGLSSGGLSPVGSILMYGGAAAPSGWLLCNGSSLLRASYPDLFAAIGTAYGSADATHFNLPDLRQRFPLGKAASGTGASLGASGGAIDHGHTVPAHYHSMGAGADLAVSVSSTVPVFGDGTPALTSFANPGGTNTKYASLSAAISGGRIGLVTGGVDGNAAMTSGTNNPPFVTVNYIIRY